MNNVNDLIARHAYLSAGIQRETASGRQIPEHVRHELQRIEATAQATLTPMELQQAQAASQSMTAQYMQQADLQTAQRDAKHRSYYAGKLSQELTGFTPDQLMAIEKGEKYIVKGGGLDTQGMRTKIAEMAERDLGQKLTYKQFEAVSDRVANIRDHRGDEAAAQYLARKFGDKAEQATAMIDGLQRSGIDYNIALAEKMGRTREDDYEVEPTKDDIRRAQIANAWANDARDNEASRNALIESDISDEYLESEFMHGDIARAMAKHDAEDRERELAEYTPPEYNVGAT